MRFVSSIKDATLEDTTVVMPSVGFGNIGQMTIDLMLNTWIQKFNSTDKVSDVQYIGSIESDYVEQIFGNDPFGRHVSDAIPQYCTSIDVFQHTSLKLTFLQLRARVIEGYEETFVLELCNWLSSCNIRQLFILTGADASQRVSSQLVGQQFRYIRVPNETCSSETVFMNAGIPQLEPSTATEANIDAFITNSSQSNYDDVSDDITSTEPSTHNIDTHTAIVDQSSTRATLKVFGDLAGIGYAARIYRRVLNNHVGFETIVLLRFISEGDNIPDTICMANALQYCLEIQSINSTLSETEKAKQLENWPHHSHQFKFPPSWSRLSGNDRDSSMYT